MLGIFAQSFMTATRTGTVPMRDAPSTGAKKPARWLPEGHWWRKAPREIDPRRL